MPGDLVRLRDRPANPLVVAERVEEADALRAGEDEVEAGHGGEPLLLLDALARLRVEPLDRDRPVLDRRAQARAARRVEAAEERPEVALMDDAREVEGLGAAARPHPRRLSPTGVVVVETAGDLLLVVALLADRELGHTQHAGSSSETKGAETHMH